MLGALAKIASKTADIGKELLKGLLGGQKIPKGRQATEPIDYAAIDSSTKVLGLIYATMQRARVAELANRIQDEKDHKDKLDDENKRNDELIKALTVRRKPKKKKKEEPKEEPKKEEKKKPPTKKEEVKKEETKKEVKKEAPPKAEKVTKKEVKPEVKKAEEVKKEAPKAPEKAPAKESPKPSAEKIPTGVGAGKSALISALSAAGYSQTAQANVLANVKEESNFIPHSENLGKYNATNLFKMFGPPGQEFTGRQGSGKGKKLIANPKNEKGKSNTVRFNTIEDAEKLVSQGPEAVAEVIYGGRMGNTSPGDGYKYIGRGYIQLTGKENYTKIGKLIGVDLVNNPELANDPEIAAKIVPAFFKVGGKKPADLENIDVAIDTVGSASASSRQERKRLASEYQSKGFGDTLDQSSKENKDMKDAAATAKKQQTVNNTTVNQTNTQSSSSSDNSEFDDRNAQQKKKG